MKAAELFDLSGRVAMVTGASSGLGARFAMVRPPWSGRASPWATGDLARRLPHPAGGIA